MTQDVTPTTGPLSFKPDDDELSRAVAEKWRERARFFHDEWHIYENGSWQPRAFEEMSLGLRGVLRTFRSQQPDIEINISQRRVSGIARLLREDLYIPNRELEALQPEQEKYINLRNGLYNLSSFQLEQHNPALRFTTQLNFEFDKEATCPAWEHFLNTSLVIGEALEPDEQLISLLQEALAYSITARTDLKASFWLVGKPDSGKSTLVALIGGLLGSMHTTIDLNQLGKNRFLFAGIVGKRAVTFTEAEESVVLSDAIYKSMVGGTDEIYIDVKNRQGFAYKPIAKFWWAMNSAPRITDRSGATFNRLKVIPFNRTIPPSNRIGNLFEQLMSERAGIFNWLLEGYARLLEKGRFTVSEQSEQSRQSLMMKNDTEQTFINEMCERREDYRIQSQELYDTYRNWCQSGGFKPKNMNQVAEDWARLGFQKRIYEGRHFWHGLRIRPDTTSPIR